MLGALLIYIKCAIFTLMFYLVFKFIMIASSPNQVLSSSGLTSEGHNAWWYNLIIFFGCLGYTFLLANNIIRFTWINRKDMGLEASLNSLGVIASGISGGFSGISNAIGDYFGGLGASLSGGKSTTEESVKTSSVTNIGWSSNADNKDNNKEFNRKASDGTRVDTFLDAVNTVSSDKEVKTSGWGSKDIDSSIARGEKKVESKEDKS